MAALFKENEKDLSKKKIEFNHIKVSGEQISQESSSGELDINKVKEENDKKMKKIFVEEIKEKNENKISDKDIKEKEKDNNDKKKNNKNNELDDLD